MLLLGVFFYGVSKVTLACFTKKGKGLAKVLSRVLVLAKIDFVLIIENVVICRHIHIYMKHIQREKMEQKMTHKTGLFFLFSCLDCS